METFICSLFGVLRTCNVCFSHLYMCDLVCGVGCEIRVSYIWLACVYVLDLFVLPSQ